MNVMSRTEPMRELVDFRDVLALAWTASVV
jgi:hypothetical protein